MGLNAASNPSPAENVQAGIRKRFVQIVLHWLILAACLFIPAGTLRWPMAWVYLGVFAGWVVVNAAIMLNRSPELVAERAGGKDDAKGWDLIVAGLFMLFAEPVTLVVAGLNVRFGWTPPVATWIVIAGLVVWMLGNALFSWAMFSNAYFSAQVRIQADRGHAVATSGPYRVVRHPGYVGAILSAVGRPLMLGSAWALIPAALGIAFLAVRTAIEDRTLHEELDGYDLYARRVRYRLIPGIW
jgi:protein-S-isoprenylcysteine O-methyltransferase Ste14